MEKGPLEDGSLPREKNHVRAHPVPARWKKLLAVVVVILLISVPLVALVGPKFPWEQAVLARGRTYLDMPLATMYTAPGVSYVSVETTVDLGFSSGLWLTSNSAVPPAFIHYTWSLVGGTNLPVQFVMTPGPDSPRYFQGGSKDEFTFLPAGPLSRNGTSYLNASAQGPGIQSVFVTKWAMDYTVRKMGVLQGLVPTAYLQVDYSLAMIDRGTLLPLPAANVSLPAAADLIVPIQPLSVGPSRPIDLGGNSLSRDSRPPYSAFDPFQYNLTPIALDAGAAGTLTARVTSTFWWMDVCDNMNQCWPMSSYTLHLSVPNGTIWVQPLLDRRFGSLLLEYTAAPAP